MATKAGEILVLLFVGLAIGFWVVAMTTHGWLIIHEDGYRGRAYDMHEVSMNK